MNTNTVSLVSVMISIIEIRVVVVVVSFFLFSVDPTRLLLTFNVSVNLGDKYHKNTALHWSVLAGNTTVISLLLEAGANVDAQNIKVKVSYIYAM